MFVQILYHSQNSHKKINKIDQKFRKVHRILSNEQIVGREKEQNSKLNSSADTSAKNVGVEENKVFNENDVFKSNSNMFEFEPSSDIDI